MTESFETVMVLLLGKNRIESPSRESQSHSAIWMSTQSQQIYYILLQPAMAGKMRKMKTSLMLFSSETFGLESLEINLIWSRRKLLKYDLQEAVPIRFQTTLMEIYYFVRHDHMSLEFYL